MKHILSFVSAAVIAHAVILTSASSTEAQRVRELHLGPGLAPTVEISSPKVVYRIGDPDGLGMLEQVTGLMMAPVPAGGVFVHASYGGGGSAIQHFRGGEFVRTFGRAGSGPGEYERVSGLTVDTRTGEIWVLDSGRLVSFGPDGTPGKVVSTASAGPSVRDPIVLLDGSLLLNGPGGLRANMGYVVHSYEFDQESWTSYHPVLRDSAFNAANDRRWVRAFATTREGKLVAVSRDYVIEVMDPQLDFAMVARIRRTPESWPDDVAADYQRRLKEDALARTIAVVDTWIDAQDRLWVLATIPDRNWKEKIGKDPQRPWVDRSFNAVPDLGQDSLVEVIDLASMRVLASYRMDPLARFIVGPGLYASYAGDLPYPQLEIIEISLQ